AERVGLLGRIGGTLIRDVGGGRGAFEEAEPLLVVCGADLQDRARKAQPVRRFARRDRDDLRQGLHAGAEVTLLELEIGLAPQRGDGLSDLSGFGFDLGFQADRAVCKVCALEGLVGGKSGERHKSDERGGKAGADGREHRRPSLSARGRAHVTSTYFIAWPRNVDQVMTKAPRNSGGRGRAAAPPAL